MSTLFSQKTRAKNPVLSQASGRSVGKVVFNLVTVTDFVDENYDCSFNSWSNEEIIDGKPVTDADINRIRGEIEETYRYEGVTCTSEVVASSISAVCRMHSFDPLCDRLDNAHDRWIAAGRPQNLERLFVDYLGCDDNDYTRTVTKIIFYGLIGRAYQPGLKYDYLPIISGAQGQGKSTLLKKLGGEFFDDSLDVSMFGTEQATERLYKGIWLAELQEMAKMAKADENTLKMFLSSASDSYRPKYMRKVETLPRRTVFIGTTNQKWGLFSDTVNRRFILLNCNPKQQTKFSWDMTVEERDLLLGEAVEMYKQGMDLYALLMSIKETQTSLTDEYVSHDENFTDLETFLRMPRPENWNELDAVSRGAYYKKYLRNPDDSGDLVPDISVREIWCEALGHVDHSMTNRDSYGVVRALTLLGYNSRTKETIPQYGRTFVYHLE